MTSILKRIAPLVVVLVCFGNVIYAQTADPPAPGWVAYKPTGDYLRCANYSKNHWKVTLNSDRSSISISKFDDRQRRLEIPVAGGRLIGENHGEWGGGLWWVSKDGRSRKKLSDENIRGLVQTSSGVIIIAGLSHMSLDYGIAFRYIDGPYSKKGVKEIADLNWSPDAFVMEAPDTLLVLTKFELMRLHALGRKEVLFKTDYRGLYPSSLTLSPLGVIHVGMRHFVTRLTPVQGGGYTQEWFVPANCARFTIQDTDCVCKK